MHPDPGACPGLYKYAFSGLLQNISHLLILSQAVPTDLLFQQKGAIIFI
ncbi:Uncharacterized protein dnm_090330 [Desulfonema magnum]|uniref:Uncharacterized protein n=1 Tax=Desulfonema magnum TaxID=45655 RepID=A0A975GTB1_9BACT|nr:Uncharacterized protein dnm_090330 [Desulfonema magnum]